MFRFIMMPVIILLLISCSLSAQDGWYRANPQRTGYYENAGVEKLHGVKWRFQTDREIVSSPVIAGNIVVFGGLDGKVYALDAQTGNKLWDLQTSGPVSGSAAIVDGIVYIASEGGGFYAIEAKSGNEKWRISLNPKISTSPMVYDGRVYIPQGHAKWTSAPHGYNTAEQSTRKVVGLDISNGRPVWKSKGSGSQGFDAPIVLDGDLFSSYGREGYALYSLENGNAKWRYHRRNSYGSQFVCSALDDGMFYIVGSINGTLHAVDAASGEEKWRNTNADGQSSVNGGGDQANAILTSPAVYAGRIYVGTENGRFLCLNAKDGKKMWVKEYEKPIQSSPSLTTNLVYFGDHDGKLRALNRINGDEVWEYDAGARILTSPAIYQNSVIFGASDGIIYCLE